MLISKSLNHVYGGKIFDKAIMTNYSVALHFNQISYEGVTNGMYIEGACGNLFHVPRVGELSASNKTIKLKKSLLKK